MRHQGDPVANPLNGFAGDEQQLACLQGFGVSGPEAAVGEAELAEDSADRQVRFCRIPASFDGARRERKWRSARDSSDEMASGPHTESTGSM
jgi:hypothetical protein